MHASTKIGLGIITCDRPAGLQKALTSLPWEWLDRVVVVNDGDPVSSEILREAGPQRYLNYSAPGLGKKSDKLYRNAKTNPQFDPK
jgi:hypothetical protein